MLNCCWAPAALFHASGPIHKEGAAFDVGIIENIKAPNAKGTLFDISKVSDIYKSKKLSYFNNSMQALLAKHIA